MTSSIIMINKQIAHLTANFFNIFDLLLFCLRQKKHQTAQTINVTRINRLVNINSSGVSNPKKRKSVCIFTHPNPSSQNLLVFF